MLLPWQNMVTEATQKLNDRIEETSVNIRLGMVLVTCDIVLTMTTVNLCSMY